MNPGELEREFTYHSNRGGDISEHLGRLRELASGLDYITELGTRGADGSTVAFLAAQPKRLWCYDIAPAPNLQRFGNPVGRTELRFTQVDVLTVTLEETDLLFIDTLHTYTQLSAELWLHSEKARRFIVLHDTTTFGHRDEVGGGPGLWPAVEEFVERARGVWRVAERYEHNNGLTILTRG